MEKRRHHIIVILAGMLVGILLFIFGIRLANHNVFIDMIYTIMSVVILGSCVVASFKQYQQEKDYMFIFLMILSIFLIGISIFYVVGDIL